MTKAEAALDLARRGFRVFPLNPDEPWEEGNDKRAKEPRAGFSRWQHLATSDEAQVRSWWSDGQWNIGVCTTGLIVFDIDTKHGGEAFMSYLDLGGSIDTFAVETWSGGAHYYFTGPDVANSASTLAPHLDVRGHHGYVLGPGSTINGRAYSVAHDVPVRAAPAEIAARCRPPGQKADNRHVALVEEDTPLSFQLGMEYIRRQPGAPAGERNHELYKHAAQLRGYGMSLETASFALDTWAIRCSPAVPPEHVRAVAQNAWLYSQDPAGIKNPAAAFSGVSIPPPPPAPPAAPPVPADLPVPPDLEAILYVPPELRPRLRFGNALDPQDMEERPWLLGGMLLRRDVTVVVAPGGGGKSTMQLTMAVQLALGMPCMGHQNFAGRPVKSVVYDAEDSLEEMSKRVLACCLDLGVEYRDVANMIMLISGKTDPLVLMTGQIATRNEQDIALLTQICADPEVGMLAVNPLNKLHTCNSVDNVTMNQVMGVLSRIAHDTDVAVCVAHHTPKLRGLPLAGNSEASQGANAVRDSARIMLTLAPMESAEAAQFGIKVEEINRYIRLDGAKLNNGLLDHKPTWIYKKSVQLVLRNFKTEMAPAFVHVKLEERADQQALRFAELLHEKMVRTDGGGSMKLTEAARHIRQADEIYGRLDQKLVEMKLSDLLAAGIAVGNDIVKCFVSPDAKDRGAYIVKLV